MVKTDKDAIDLSAVVVLLYFPNLVTNCLGVAKSVNPSNGSWADAELPLLVLNIATSGVCTRSAKRKDSKGSGLILLMSTVRTVPDLSITLASFSFGSVNKNPNDESVKDS